MSLLLLRTSLSSTSMLQSPSILLQPKPAALWRPTGFAIQLESGGAPCRMLSSSSRYLNSQQALGKQRDDQEQSFKPPAGSSETTASRLHRPSANSSLAPPSAQHSPIRNVYTDPALRLPQHFGKNQEQIVSEETKRILEKVVGHFRAVRWAVAYGSGVFDQAGYNPNGPKPLLDFVFATSHPSHFHALNLQANPEHYPLFARWLGSDYISKVQDWGAGVWYCTNVTVDGQTIKYGVIATDALCEDLMDWTTLYISGRMHKPVRIIRPDPRVLLANQVNLASALRVALLMLPETFTERQLWEQVAGISYAGDPRMSIPGAENPRKVKNIVRPQIRRFRLLYARLLDELGHCEPVQGGAAVAARHGEGGGSSSVEVTAKTPAEEKDVAIWRKLGLVDDVGMAEIRQPTTPAHRAELLRKLPRRLKKALETRYAAKLGVRVAGPGDDAVSSSAPSSDSSSSSMASTASASKDSTTTSLSGSPPELVVVSPEAFWHRVASTEPSPDLRRALDTEIRLIIRSPAIGQSLKGLLTAGLRKSARYAAAKMRKWWYARGVDVREKKKEKKGQDAGEKEE